MQRQRSSTPRRLALAALGLIIIAPPSVPAIKAQYPGHMNSTVKPGPVLRSVAVLEWTGAAGKPSASRLIPVAVFHDGSYEDGGLYLARPEPLALDNGTEYQLLQAGLPKGVYDVFSAGQLAGNWFGYGAWKPLPPPEAFHHLKESVVAPEVVDGGDDRRPHFRKAAPEASGPGGGAPTQTNPPEDPDRPRLSKRSTAPADNSPTANTSTASATGDLETATAGGDPDRPRLSHGAKAQPAEPAHLEGTPPALEQMVAVSDAATRTDHSFRYSWPSPEDATKMQTALTTLAQQAIAKAEKPLTTKPLTTRPATGRSTAATVHKNAAPSTAAGTKAHSATSSSQSTAGHSAAMSTTPHRATTARRKPIAHAPVPVTLTDVQFSAFELTYSGGATLVFTARTAGDEKSAKYVTIIAQPDIYGTPRVLLTQVTSANDLDAVPRMRLVDAVDVAGNNRGDLLFELRGSTGRQFAIYRVASGRVDQMIATATMSLSATPAEATP